LHPYIGGQVDDLRAGDFKPDFGADRPALDDVEQRAAIEPDRQQMRDIGHHRGFHQHAKLRFVDHPAIDRRSGKTENEPRASDHAPALGLAPFLRSRCRGGTG
jgi:hypothetical protein